MSTTDDGQRPRPDAPALDGVRLDQVGAFIARAVAESPKIALTRAEAADKLGVSVEFFDEHVAPDLRSVRRGRRRLYPLGELLHWLCRSAEPPETRADGGHRPQAAVVPVAVLGAHIVDAIPL